MNTTKTTTHTTDKTKRRMFAPIQMDLVERLTRQADSLADRLLTAENGSELTKLAA